MNAASAKRASPSSSSSPTSTSPPRHRSPRPCAARWRATAGSARPSRSCSSATAATAKPHLLIGLGIFACQRGLRVRNTTATSLGNELAEAAQERQLSPLVARYGRIDLLCLDELNYVHLDPHRAELLFQILTEREERATVAVASNAPFSEQGQSYDDPRLAAGVVDRLIFRAYIIETGSVSPSPRNEVLSNPEPIRKVGPVTTIKSGQIRSLFQVSQMMCERAPWDRTS